VAIGIVLALSAGCGDGLGEGTAEVDMADLLADPGSYADERIRVRATYLENPQVRVLTDALAESYPPQAGGAQIWVEGRAPEGDCVISDIGVTWGEVEAVGAFRYSAEGGLGIPPIFEMALADATITCP
jgi:hypothetical protein